jgi:hypothetical protein
VVAAVPREAVAVQRFVDAPEVDRATHVAIARLNRRTKPWICNRSPKSPRNRRRGFPYLL